MKSPVVKGEAKERILLAAEDLIAKHGVDGVSLRSINAAAGVSAGILHYHFGNLDNMLDTLLERHMAPLMAERLILYETLLTEPHITVRAVVELLVLPLARKIIEQGDAGSRYVRFLARLNTDRAPEIHRIFTQTFGKEELIKALVSALPSIPEVILRARFLMCAQSMVHCLADLANPASPSSPSDAETRQCFLEKQVDILIEFLCGGLAAPTKTASGTS